MGSAKTATRLVLAALLAASAGGCKATLTLKQYPPFYDPRLKSIAVAPFADHTLHPGSGQFVAERLAAALAANGTYDVTGPTALKAKLAAAKVPLPAGADAAALAAALRALGGVQAFVAGRVKAFGTDRSLYTELDAGGFGAGYGWHRWHGWGHSYPYYRHYSYTRAHVAADAVLVRVADGQAIGATPSTLTARIVSRGDLPVMPDECLDQAAQAVARRLVEAFAVVEKRIKVPKGKTLRTARRRDGDELDFTNDFRPDEKELLVVLALPPQADRNRFLLAVTRKGRAEPLAEREFEWSGEHARRAFAFSLAELFEAGGTGDYHAALYAGEKLVLKRGFEIER